jgi:hypothetical protein
MFSKRVAASGGKVMATKALNVIHHGMTKFPSTSVWGHRRDPNALGV